jgi:hypothetical protein
LKRSRDHSGAEGTAMDIILLILGVALFAATALYVAACDAL